MATITPEQRHEIEKAGDQPVGFEDPQSHAKYVLIKAELYERMRLLLGIELANRSVSDQDDSHPKDAYPAVDRAFAVGWDDPKMDDYDRYEQHRP